MKLRALTPILLVLMAPLVGCNDDDKKNTSTSGGSGAWAVGEDATMVRLNPEGDVWYYPLEVEGDLRAIACKGEATGVAVGDDGVVLRTDDSGETWKTIDVGTRAPLRAVILSGTTPAYIAGDGIVLRSDDDGHSFRAVPDAEADFTSVTTTAKGTYAWLTTASGQIWQLDGEVLKPVFTTSEGPLSGIAVTPDGESMVAVGAGGLVVRSDDGGAHWSSLPTPTRRDLHAVRISRTADLVVAVGAAGVVLRLDDNLGDSAQELLEPGLALRALHLAIDGQGQAVGDHGVVLRSHDAGVAWEALDLGLEEALFGLDDLHGEPHL
ncbi:WD40/YVTN/BNR-like repeat-containing protein [Nannocystis bainbridge]|uniref:YCF48-related protein n=1 Tax=Nannocystis bainbridge TaxID=2995303 RepID=A0ABT5E4N5_9BACT|nr:YCF48-related protein [Nannocystis bainbridge]MDC0720801.1 YCF48-related protein [Nannocystis bainbridge]